jgi:thiol-disulfide isomerase/thioredoxin
MRVILILSVVIFFACSYEIHAQQHSTWYNLNLIEKDQFSLNIAISKVEEDQVQFSGLPDNISHLTYNKLFLSKGDGSASSLRTSLFGCRGTIENKEVLIIDKNMDRSISSDEIIYLPELQLSDSIEYDSIYLYPTGFRQIVELEYDHIINNQIIKVPHTFILSVPSRYNSKTKKLFYADKFSADHFHKLSCNLEFQGEMIRIETNNHLPWQSTYRFLLAQNDSKSQISFKEEFKIDGTNKIYLIDSIDIINKRILISPADNLSKYRITGMPINDAPFIDTDELKNDKILIHYWGTWCGPCIKNMPKIKEISHKYPDLRIIGVAVGGSKKSTLAFTKRENMNWPNLYFYDTEELYTKSDLEILAFPTYVLIDKEKKILGQFATTEDLEKSLTKNYR